MEQLPAILAYLCAALFVPVIIARVGAVAGVYRMGPQSLTAALVSGPESRSPA